MARKSDFEKGNDAWVDSCAGDCHTERGEGRKITTGDGRRTIKDRSDDD